MSIRAFLLGLLLWAICCVGCGGCIAIAAAAPSLPTFLIAFTAAVASALLALWTTQSLNEAAGEVFDVQLPALIIRARFWWRRRRALRQLAGQTTALAFGPYR